jgi:hypothetical protein
MEQLKLESLEQDQQDEEQQDQEEKEKRVPVEEIPLIQFLEPIPPLRIAGLAGGLADGTSKIIPKLDLTMHLL